MSNRVGPGRTRSRSLEQLVGAGSPGTTMRFVDGVNTENGKPSNTSGDLAPRVRSSAGSESVGQGEVVEELEDGTEIMSGTKWGIGEAIGTAGKLDFPPARCECMSTTYDCYGLGVSHPLISSFAYGSVFRFRHPCSFKQSQSCHFHKFCAIPTGASLWIQPSTCFPSFCLSWSHTWLHIVDEFSSSGKPERFAGLHVQPDSLATFPKSPKGR